jgi:hypothetical protein
MHEFVISKEGLSKLKKALIKRILLFTGITSLLVILVSVSISGANDGLVYIIGILIISIAYSVYSNTKKQQAMFESYKLIITDDAITREQLNTPSITILKKDITEIVKSKNGSFGIVGPSKLNPIGIPAQLERIDELEILLHEIRSITINKVAPLALWIQLGILALAGILLYGTFKVENNIISGLAGLGAVSYLIYSYVIIQRSKNIDRRTKLLSHVIWVPILSLLSIVITKLMS